MYFIGKLSNIVLNRTIAQSVILKLPSLFGPCFCHVASEVNPLCIQKKVYIPVNDLTNLNLDSSKYDISGWKKILGEINFARENGRNVPSAFTLENVEELLRLESFTQRFKYVNFLFKKEKKRLSEAEKKLKRTEKPLVTCSKCIGSDSHIRYGLGKNTMMMGIRKQVIHQYYNKRLAKASLFGQKLVFDLGYDDYMRTKERRDCAAQLRLAHSNNRKHIWPFDLHFCNASYESHCYQYLKKEMPNICDSMINVTEKSYLDLFPRNKLVYLSPHATETLEVFDHDAVYIIGAFVDMVKREAVSIRKAEKENIQSLSLPIDSYILWGSGSKSLSIDQVFSIIMTFRDTGDWSEAFKHIPTRKIRKIDPHSNEPEIVSNKVFLLKNC